MWITVDFPIGALRDNPSRVEQYADPAQAIILLRTCRERPRSRDANESDELAPLHSARMRASLANLDEGEFTEGHELDRKWKVAKEMIGRRLSQEEGSKEVAPCHTCARSTRGTSGSVCAVPVARSTAATLVIRGKCFSFSY